MLCARCLYLNNYYMHETIWEAKDRASGEKKRFGGVCVSAIVIIGGIGHRP